MSNAEKRTEWSYFKRNDGSWGFRFKEQHGGQTANLLEARGVPGAEELCQEVCAKLNSYDSDQAKIKALVGAVRAALPYMKHSLKFYRYQKAGNEFWPNKEEAEANIENAEAALSLVKGE